MVALSTQACAPEDSLQHFTVSRRGRVLNLHPKLFPGEYVQRQTIGAPRAQANAIEPNIDTLTS